MSSPRMEREFMFLQGKSISFCFFDQQFSDILGLGVDSGYLELCISLIVMTDHDPK